MYGCLPCSRSWRRARRSFRATCGGVRIPWSVSRRDSDAYRVDLRVFLHWCTDQDLDPLAAVEVDIERYVRWLQDVRRYQPSTVSRRLSVVVGFYRVCVIDQILPNSPADYVRRPTSARGVAHPRAGSSAIRSADYRLAAAGQPERLRPGRAARPARATDLRGMRGQYRRPRRGARPPGAAGLWQRAARSCSSRWRRSGRPRTLRSIRALALRLAPENSSWDTDACTANSSCLM